MNTQHPMLNTAIKAARRAGSMISRASRELEKLTIQHKSAHDLVSEVDRAAEAAIIQTILEAYPKHAILAEESGSASGVDASTTDYQWIIDPLDGTTNFLHGFPYYCVSVALVHRGQLSHGVIFDPNRNDLFTASRGGGAFLNQRRIRVSRRQTLIDALLATGLPASPRISLAPTIHLFEAFSAQAQAVRSAGAAALDLAYVAAGWLDGFWEEGLAPWDVAAGALLVLEAGGLISDFGASENFLHGGEIIAASPKVFVPMLSLIKKSRRSLPAP